MQYILLKGCEFAHTIGNSKCIDFMLIEFQNRNKIIIRAFDVTLNDGQVASMIRDFLNVYKYFTDRKNNKITINKI